MKISFEFDDKALIFLLEILPTWFFIMDIFVSLNTAYYKSGMIHSDRPEIVKNYISSRLK